MKYSQSSPKKEFETLWLKLFPVTSPDSAYAGFAPGTTVLKKGQVMEDGCMPLPCDILLERDVPIVLRDGVTVYADVYRPTDAGQKVPALMNWNPAGKQGRHDMTFPGMAEEDREFPRASVSGLQVWLCNDPARWVPEGYAVVSVDPRGVYASEGDMSYFGEIDALDGCECIDWISRQAWCNGNVGMAGNAFTAIEQWFMAAKKPPALKAIAPWEGHGDFYREEFVVGGIPKGADTHMRRTYGAGRIEFASGMAEKYPYMNAYWEGKRVDPADIDIPAYVVASYCNANHTRGTIDMFRGLASREKWLRIHNTSEMHDFRSEDKRQDLQKFFDHFLKGIDNGWEKTPAVRVSVLDHGHTDIVDRPEQSFPLERQILTRLYLHSGGTLSPAPAAAEALDAYDCIPGQATLRYTYTFPETTEITGYSKLHLWVQGEGCDDMDLFVFINKLDDQGMRTGCNFFTSHPKLLHPGASAYSGPFMGRLRASMRQTDPARSLEEIPYYTFTGAQKLQPGQIVPLDIGIPPTGLVFHAGETLELLISGQDFNGAGSGTLAVGMGANYGRHIVHMGGQYDSYLLLPVIPNKED